MTEPKTAAALALGVDDAVAAIYGAHDVSVSLRAGDASEYYLWTGEHPDDRIGRYWVPSLVRQDALPGIVDGLLTRQTPKGAPKYATREAAAASLRRFHTGIGNSEIAALGCAFVEMDDCARDEQERRLRHVEAETGLGWALWVFSGGKSVHAYLAFARLMQPTEPLWREIQQLLIAALGGDTKIINASRLMRLPGWASEARQQPILRCDPGANHAPETVRAKLAAYVKKHVGPAPVRTIVATLQTAERLENLKGEHAEEAAGLAAALRDKRGLLCPDELSVARALLNTPAGGAVGRGAATLPVDVGGLASLQGAPVGARLACPLCPEDKPPAAVMLAAGVYCHRCGGLLVERRADRVDVLLPGRVDEATALVLQVLRDGHGGRTIFADDMGLVELIEADGGGVRAVSLSAVQQVVRAVADRASLSGFDEKGQPKDLVCLPAYVAGNIVATPPEHTGMPRLRGISHLPLATPAGAVLTRDGYDPESGMYVSLRGLVVPPVPAVPLREEVAAAVAVFDDLLCDFYFADAGSRANALAFLLTPMARPLFGGASPLFLVSAPTPGTGKTLLTEVVAALAGGSAVVQDLTVGRRDDENTAKNILAALRAQPAIVRIDNMPTKQMDSPELARALTSPVYSGRVLGISETVSLSNRATWCATGNAPNLSPELAARSVEICLVPDREDPRERTGFRHELPGYALEQRGAIIAAGLTLIRAWICEGSPRGTTPLGSFAEWASCLGGILDVAGVSGLLGNRDARRSSLDHETEAWRAIVEEWQARYKDEAITVRQLLAAASELTPEIQSALEGRGETPRAQMTHAGIALRERLGRVFVGWRISDGGRDKHTKARLYKLIEAGE